MEEVEKTEVKTMNNTTSVVGVAQPSKPKNDNLMKEFPKDNSNKHTMLIVIGAFLVVLVGVGTGWMLAGGSSGSGSLSPSDVAPGAKESETEAGIMDESGFEEEAPVGMLVEGGIEGEGTHYLDRGLGEEKNVYLTSTVLDLQSFVGKEVQVWGNTVAAQNAPWLMDVGKLKVVD